MKNLQFSFHWKKKFWYK